MTFNIRRKNTGPIFEKWTFEGVSKWIYPWDNIRVVRSQSQHHIEIYRAKHKRPWWHNLVPVQVCINSLKCSRKRCTHGQCVVRTVHGNSHLRDSFFVGANPRGGPQYAKLFVTPTLLYLGKLSYVPRPGEEWLVYLAFERVYYMLVPCHITHLHKLTSCYVYAFQSHNGSPYNSKTGRRTLCQY